MKQINEGLSDEALSLVNLAQAVVDAARRVETWAQAPGSERLEEVAEAVDKASLELRAAIAAHLETGRPSLAQMEWRFKIASDRSSRAWAALEALHSEWWSDAWHAACDAHDEAYKAYLQAQRDLRSHPDWLPKSKGKKKSKR